jgi:hypothetical protein
METSLRRAVLAAILPIAFHISSPCMALTLTIKADLKVETPQRLSFWKVLPFLLRNQHLLVVSKFTVAISRRSPLKSRNRSHLLNLALCVLLHVSLKPNGQLHCAQLIWLLNPNPVQSPSRKKW